MLIRYVIQSSVQCFMFKLYIFCFNCNNDELCYQTKYRFPSFTTSKYHGVPVYYSMGFPFIISQDSSLLFHGVPLYYCMGFPFTIPCGSILLLHWVGYLYSCMGFSPYFAHGAPLAFPCFSLYFSHGLPVYFFMIFPWIFPFTLHMVSPILLHTLHFFMSYIHLFLDRFFSNFSPSLPFTLSLPPVLLIRFGSLSLCFLLISFSDFTPFVCCPSSSNLPSF